MEAAQTDTTHNGWTNYPTWNVNLWLSNDGGLYRQVTRDVAEMLDPANEGDEPLQARLTVVDYLKTLVCDDLAPDLGASLAADLLGYALDQVNWFEIADSWIESVSEQVR